MIEVDPDLKPKVDVAAYFQAKNNGKQPLNAWLDGEAEILKDEGSGWNIRKRKRDWIWNRASEIARGNGQDPNHYLVAAETEYDNIFPRPVGFFEVVGKPREK